MTRKHLGLLALALATFGAGQTAYGQTRYPAARYRGRNTADRIGRAYSPRRIVNRRPQFPAARYRGRPLTRRNARTMGGNPLLRRNAYLRNFRGHNNRTTRGIDQHGAIVWQLGSGGRYATQARQARQARQATQARQYIQPAFRRPPFRFRRP